MDKFLSAAACCNLAEGDLSQPSGFVQLPIVQISTDSGDRLNLEIGFAQVPRAGINSKFRFFLLLDNEAG